MWSSGNLSTVQWLCLRLCLVHVKYFSENKYFSEMLFSGKENIFKCLVAFQKMFWKIFSSVWLCSWKYHRKYIFYLLFTFSQLPNKYIISFLNTETQKKQNPEKKFIKSGQIERRRKREVCGAAIGAVRSLLRSARCEVRCCDRSGAIGSVCGCWTGARSEDWALSSSSFPLSLSLSLRVSLEMVWSENFHFKPFLGQSLKNARSLENNFRKIYFPCATEHPHLRKSIFGSDLKPKQT